MNVGGLRGICRCGNQSIARFGINGRVFCSQKKSVYQGSQRDEKPFFKGHRNDKPMSQSVADVLKSNTSNKLVSPVHIPQDYAETLHSDHPAMAILAEPSIVIQRQLEMMNVLLGFEQANKYTIMDPQGNHIGYLAEQEHGMANVLTRQLFRTHRGFTTHVLSKEGREVLRFCRPFSWITSNIRIFDAVPSSYLQPSENGMEQEEFITQAKDVGKDSPPSLIETVQSARLDANIIESHQADSTLNQFAYVNEPFLSWIFTLLGAKGEVVGSVNRNFTGLAREIFTDTGVYVLRVDAAGLEADPKHSISRTARKAQVPARSSSGMTLAQRAVMLATAVSIDFDYFSRKSSAGGFGVFPLWFPAGEAGAEAAGAEAAGTDVASETASTSGTVSGAQEATGCLGTATGRNVSTSEGASADIGSIAGVEAARQKTYGDSNSISNDSSIPKEQFEGVFTPEQEWETSLPRENPYNSNRGENGDQDSGEGIFNDYMDDGSKDKGSSDNSGSNEHSWLDWFDE